MNLLIETLNTWGDHALRLAWPMLWQSSLLIGLLFALDLLLRRKVRPAVRYALWLVVLVKLLVPPSLALPTSPGWWLGSTKVAVVTPRSTSVALTYDATPAPPLPAMVTPVSVAPSQPRLTPAAWGFVGMAAVGLGLLAWMLLRWRQVAHDARRAAEAPAWLNELLPEPRRPIRLKLTDHPQSPAVCGLVRPVILLPRSLVEHLPSAQLRAVLLHELLHLRRGDVWVNCAQALLQIIYWWHPLLWVANARIRRVREEAVDDAVMLALNEDAAAYAPTLLEVAKLALHRPMASLGLVGILESRSSLRQRIERLMDFRPPRTAGLTLGTVLAVIGFAAVAVPMGKAPAPAEAPQSAGSEAGTSSLALPTSTNAASLDHKLPDNTLVHDGRLLYEMGKLNEAQAKLEQALKQDPQNLGAKYYLELVRQARFSQNGDKRHLLPSPVPNARTNLIRVSAGRQAILAKLNNIRIDRVSFDGLPLSEVIRSLSDESRKGDPEKHGVNFLISSAVDARKPRGAVIDPATGLPVPATPAAPLAPSSIVITIQPPLTNVRLADVLDAIVKTASQPLKYSIEDHAIVFSARTAQEPPPLYKRTFKVDPNTVLAGLRSPTGLALTNGLGEIAGALRAYFASCGVDLDLARYPVKALYYNDRQGVLLVRSTLQDLDVIEAAIKMLTTVPPQINIKCKFVEISQDDSKALGFDWYLGNLSMTNSAVGGQTGAVSITIVPSSTNRLAASGSGNPSAPRFPLCGILTDPQFRVAMKALQQRSGTELIAQPEITTTSGRQAQMKATEIKTAVTGINKQALTPPGVTTTNGDESSLYVTEKMELGPVLDVVPCVLGDGYTIDLTVIPTLTEFLGYEKSPTNRVAVYVNGKKNWVTPPLPKFRAYQMAASMRVWDGQTVVLGGMVSETVNTVKGQVPVLGSLPMVGGLFRSESKTTAKKNLLVFITPTLIDPAGNRIHSEEEMPFASEGIPPQAPR